VQELDTLAAGAMERVVIMAFAHLFSALTPSTATDGPLLGTMAGESTGAPTFREWGQSATDFEDVGSESSSLDMQIQNTVKEFFRLSRSGVHEVDGVWPHHNVRPIFCVTLAFDSVRKRRDSSSVLSCDPR